VEITKDGEIGEIEMEPKLLKLSFDRLAGNIIISL
jgi:hypothetical protein